MVYIVVMFQMTVLGAGHMGKCATWWRSLSAFLADFLPELKPERSLFLLFQGI